MATNKKLQSLVINKVASKEVYDAMVAAGKIKDDELYLVEGSAEGNVVDIQLNGVSILQDKIANIVLSKSDVGLSNVDNTSDLNKPLSTAATEALKGKVDKTTTVNGKNLSTNINLSASDVGAIAATAKGANNGVAELDSTGKVPSSQLPSYVDDVLEYDSKSVFPTSGEAGKIYVDTTTNLTYRWSGSTYVEISSSLALGETESTAFRGDYGKAAYTHAVTNKGSQFASGLYKITTNGEGHVTAATAVVKEDITKLGIPAQDTTYDLATTTNDGLMSSEDKTKLDSLENTSKVVVSQTEPTTLKNGDVWIVVEEDSDNSSDNSEMK